ncbi:MAG: hypothetical protein H7201_02540 [Candidatus Saccharibacteria bacterium]|nr:hypothetical protein [Microbacteriaceae bacterium]
MTVNTCSSSISINAAELLECFQWSSDVDAERVKEDLAEVCDPELREYLTAFLPLAEASIGAPRPAISVADIVHPQDAPSADGSPAGRARAI